MEPQNIIYIIQGSFLLGVLGLMWKIGNDANAKISVLFKRFDEHKSHLELHMKDNYVHKDVIKVHIDHNNKDMERLEKKVDDGFHEIGKKLDRIIEKDSKSKG